MTTQVSSPAIVAQDLSKTYRSETDEPVLKGVSCVIETGARVALLGASGSGKSTLLNCLGLLDRPDAGSLRLLGQDPAGLDENERATFRLRNMGFVFQFHHLIPELNAQENVEIVLSLAGETEAGWPAQLLEWVGLSEKRKKYPWQLSGGEQQRVAIARALALRPKLLFTDEATGNLDRTRSMEVMELLFRANREWGTTLVSVTHDVELAAHYPVQYHLKDGRI
ncbi:MAG TPA: ABC transporter ATP-binding protein [Bdellovibrionota bacterium]|jgi:ABC-type lipoprotein export system ATPase subunit|nr:ABC transporter ATP-binding protein [Bdellovibrionota bacterium]